MRKLFLILAFILTVPVLASAQTKTDTIKSSPPPEPRKTVTYPVGVHSRVKPAYYENGRPVYAKVRKNEKKSDYKKAECADGDLSDYRRGKCVPPKENNKN